MNALIIAPNRLTVLFDHIKLVLNSLKITADIAGVSVLSDQLKRHFFAATANQYGNVWLLYAFWLIDCAMHLIIFAFKDGFFLRPHREKNLQRFAQVA